MKNENAAKSTPSTTPAEGAILKTKHLAAKFGLKPTALRRVLRSMPEYADGVHTNYAWQGESDPAIAKIAAAIKTRKEEAEKKAIAAKAALAAKAEADKKQAEVDKKAAATTPAKK